MATRVRVQLLGPVRAVGDDGDLSLRGRSARTVLARLALSAGSVVSADQLADALWHDDPPDDPSASLRSVVSRLRSQLGAETIATFGSGYRLDPVLVDVDLSEIEAAFKDVGPKQRKPEELHALLKLWDGDALVDVAWTPAFEPERARIDELRARLLDAYHESMIINRRAQEALADLERDAAAAPLRESTQLLLMRALAACGRTVDAVRAGNRYREHLIDQSGLDPSSEYDALALSLLTTGHASDDLAPTAAPAAPTSRPRPRTWVPPDTPFVGRETELEDLTQLVEMRRLVTITGPGGVGKTRLVTEFINGWALGTDTTIDTVTYPNFDTAIEMVSLATLTQANEVDSAVATALGVEVSVDGNRQAVTDRLSHSASILVLDNCEHVLPSARALVQHLLQCLGDLRIIVTSRRRLGLPDEAILDVGPLAMPLTNTIENAPTRLFLDRVQRTAPKLAISDRDRTVAVDICRLLDGLPLALELAAVRVPMFGFDGLRQRLLDGLAIPGTTATDDDRRQATIESTVAWSLALLNPEARNLFDELSVFPSWFDLAGLQQVSQNQEAIDAFTEIHDTSLIVVDGQRPAYRILEPVRQVARRHIDPELLPQIVDRYIAWVTIIIDSIEQRWIDDDCAAAQQLIIDHRADIRWSLNHFIEQGRVDIHGRFAYVLARALVERADIELIALCRVEIGPSIGGALARLTLAWAQGDLNAAAELVQEIEEQIGPDHEQWGYFNWAATTVHLYRGDTDKVVKAATIAASDDKCCASMRAQSVALWALGLLYRGRRLEAAELMAEKEAILQLSPSSGFVAYTRAEVVAVEDPERAIAYLASASDEAKAASASFGQRLTDGARLALLVADAQTEEATRLALRLVPELTQSGSYAQAWRAMRNIADLLGQLDEPETALLILDSANTDPSAPAVTSAAIKMKEDLEVQAGEVDGWHSPMPLGPLWEQVEEILRSR